MKIEITKMDHSGNGIGSIDNKIVFVPKSIPGDICDIDIIKDSKKYSVGKINKICVPSDDRVDSVCPYYSLCGGCNINNLAYFMQLDYKKNKVINIFKRYLDIDINPEIIGSKNEYKYRNKITFHVRDGVIGLIDIFDKFMPVLGCLLVSRKINDLLEVIKLEDLSKVNKIMIRECDNGLMVSIDGMYKITNTLKDKVISIDIDNKNVYKREDGFISIDKILYKVSSNSFFQVNTSNIKTLYDVILKYGNFDSNTNVIDLYCGVGSISLYIANYVKSVLGIEIVQDAVYDAMSNANLNKISNVKFICSDVSNIISDNVNCDVLIVDPPRGGIDNHSVNVINSSNIKRIIYVSCDPMTLVRDLKLMSNYNILDVTVVDMFPQTEHVESVVILERK